ncbi:hypothetical protein VIGAN_09057700, partial [Vigna angularis var. angularis]
EAFPLSRTLELCSLSRTLLLSNPLLCGVIFINPSSTIHSPLLSNLQSRLSCRTFVSNLQSPPLWIISSLQLFRKSN